MHRGGRSLRAPRPGPILRVLQQSLRRCPGRCHCGAAGPSPAPAAPAAGPCKEALGLRGSAPPGCACCSFFLLIFLSFARLFWNQIFTCGKVDRGVSGTARRGSQGLSPRAHPCPRASLPPRSPATRGAPVLGQTCLSDSPRLEASSAFLLMVM